MLDAQSVYACSLKSCHMRKDGVTATLADTGGGQFFLDIAFVREDALRIRLYAGAFDQPLYDAVRPDFFSGATVDIRESDTDVTLSTAQLTVALARDPFRFVVRRLDGQVLYEEQFLDADAVGEGQHRVPPMGFVENQGQKNVSFCARLRPDEHIFGLGERFGEFDKRGQTVRMQNSDTLGCRDGKAYKNIPFYVSSKGYGLFVNSTLESVFHIGSLSNASLCVTTPGQCLEYYILTGTMRHIVGTMTHMTGPAALPPDWSFGLWYSNGFFDGSGGAQTLRQHAEYFRAEGVPCDVMHLDCYWMRDDMWCDFVWDAASWPRHEELLKELREKGYRVCLWINPYVTCKTEMYREGHDKGFFVKTYSGETYLADLWHGLLSLCAVLDVTNPDAVRWFQDKLRGVLSQGVHALKTDFGEEIPLDSHFANGRTGAEMRNTYAGLYNKIVFDVVKEREGTGLVWARSGAAGMQKYPVCWSGDPRSCYEGMAATLRGGLSLGVSGVPFWSHDIGGFYGTVEEDVYVRWAQYGLFSSHSRLHGTTPRQPWAFAERIEKIVCDTIRLRYRLMPYVLKTARACVADGLPMVRPLWLSCPDEPAAATCWDEYFFGEDFLVAPVFGGDGAERSVYLPAGNWKHWFTGETFEGGRYYRLRCPLDEMLLFVRLDAVIELWEELPAHVE